jgi:hypothetical protein
VVTTSRVATHGRTRVVTNGRGVSPWVVEGRPRSVALSGGRSGATPRAIVVVASATIGGGTGMRAPMEHDKGCSRGWQARRLSTAHRMQRRP